MNKYRNTAKLQIEREKGISRPRFLFGFHELNGKEIRKSLSLMIFVHLFTNVARFSRAFTI